MPTTRSLKSISADIAELSPADAQTVGSIAYQLRSVKLTDATDAERAFARLLKDIANGQGDDLRMAVLASDR